MATARQHSMGGKDLLEFLPLPQKMPPQSSFPHLEIHLHYTQEPPDPIPLVQGSCSFRNRNSCVIDVQDVEKEESGLSWALRWKCFLWWFQSSFDSLVWARVGDQGSPQQAREGCFCTPRILAVPEQDIGKTLWKRKENLHLGLVVM